MTPTVAVIGAGPLGLMALKVLKEDGWNATSLEARKYVGGLWRLSKDSGLSALETTSFNSSRFRSAISDYPFPDDFDDFPSSQQMNEYFEGYADHFKLRDHIQLNSRATGITRKKNKWDIQITPENGSTRIESFDKVIVATGTFVQPKIPKIEGIETFAGRVLHAIDFHNASEFKNQTVLMVGLHATAQDVALALHKANAAKLYLAHRSGVLMAGRYNPDGRTYDQIQTLNLTSFSNLFQRWAPRLFGWAINALLRSMQRAAFPEIPKAWNFTPAPSFCITPPLVTDDKFYELMRSDYATPVASVKRIIGSSSVELMDGQLLEDIDAIVYCTGYDFSVPFLAPEYNPYAEPGAVAKLYRGIFSLHPDPDVRNSLAFAGQAAAVFPGFVQYEMVSALVSQIWLGNVSLPSYEEQLSWLTRHLKWREDLIRQQKKPSVFYVGFMPAEHIEWVDEMSGSAVFEHFSWRSWSAWRFWWNEPKMYKLCATGLFTPAIWRLFDTGRRKAWAGARHQILRDNEIADQRMRQRKEELENEEQGKVKSA